MAQNKQLNNRECKELISLFKGFGIDLSKYKKFELIFDKVNILFADKTIIGFFSGNAYFPSLKLLINENPTIPCVYIDLGAIPHITKGADLMRPGLKEFDIFEKGQLVIIKDVIHKKPIALGIAEYSSEEIKQLEKGKVINNIHYVGDFVWNYQNK